VEQPAKSPLNCSICNKPVAVEVAKTDDSGQAVHEECYALKLGVESHRVPVPTSKTNADARRSLQSQ